MNPDLNPDLIRIWGPSFDHFRATSDLSRIWNLDQVSSKIWDRVLKYSEMNNWLYSCSELDQCLPSGACLFRLGVPTRFLPPAPAPTRHLQLLALFPYRVLLQHPHLRQLWGHRFVDPRAFLRRCVPLGVHKSTIKPLKNYPPPLINDPFQRWLKNKR